MTDQGYSGAEPAEHAQARADIVEHAREAFEHDLERQRKHAELIEELSRASMDMQRQVDHREDLMNAMLDAQSSSGNTEPTK